MGFNIDTVRALLTLQDNPTQFSGAADAIARDRLAEVEQGIDSLTALKAELESMIESCSHGKVANCRVIEVLADHRQCARLDHSVREDHLSGVAGTHVA